MKKTEKNALKNAFGIPEPRHKEEFIAEYTRRLESRRRSPVPVFIKYAAVAAFAVIMISIGITHLPSPDKKFTGSDVIAETTTADDGTGASGTQDNGIVITTDISGSTDVTVTTEPVTSGTSDGTTSGGDITSSEAAASGTVTSSGTSSSVTTGKTTTTKRTTASGTTTAKTTTARTTTAKTTTSKTVTTVSSPQNTVSATETTTYLMEEGTQPLTSDPPSVSPAEPPVSDNQKNDYTVKPSVIYYPIDPPVSDNEYPGADPGVPDSPTSPGSTSDTIVYGTVKRIYYTSFNDTVYTQIDVEIGEAYRSSYLRYGDLITVYVRGGFRLDTQIGNYVKTEYGFKPVVNASYLLMLNSSGTPFPYRTFVLSDPREYSVYTFDGSEYTSAIDRGIRYSFYTMKQFIF